MKEHSSKANAIVCLWCLTALLCAGCFYSHTEKEVPAPVAVTPSETTTTVVHEPAGPSAATPPETERETTTRWNDGTVVEKQTKTEPATGTVRKRTTTTWNGDAGAPDQTTTTTTTAAP